MTNTTISPATLITRTFPQLLISNLWTSQRAMMNISCTACLNSKVFLGFNPINCQVGLGYVIYQGQYIYIWVGERLQGLPSNLKVVGSILRLGWFETGPTDQLDHWSFSKWSCPPRRYCLKNSCSQSVTDQHKAYHFILHPLFTHIWVKGYSSLEPFSKSVNVGIYYWPRGGWTKWFSTVWVFKRQCIQNS